MKGFFCSACLAVILIFVVIDTSFAEERNIWVEYKVSKGSQVKTTNDVFFAKIDLRSQFRGLWSEN